MMVGDNVWYCGIANKPSAAYSSNFFSFHTLNDKLSVKGFCGTLQARVVISGMQVDDDVLYCGVANQLSAYSFLYLSDFHSFHTLNNDLFCQRCLWNHAHLICRLLMMYCIVGCIETNLSRILNVL